VEDWPSDHGQESLHVRSEVVLYRSSSVFIRSVKYIVIECFSFMFISFLVTATVKYVLVLDCVSTPESKLH